MEQRGNTEQLMTRYLLGELSEEDQIGLETEYFADPERLEQLKVIEHDLIEGYVSGKLSIIDRANFERSYLSSPARRERVRFFQTLTKAVPLETNQSLPAQAIVRQTPQPIVRQTPNVSTHLDEITSWWQHLLALFRGPAVVA